MNIHDSVAIRVLSVFCVACLLAPSTALSLDAGIKFYTLAEMAETAESSRNPDNRFAKISDQHLRAVLKADLYENLGRWQLSARPGLKLDWDQATFSGQDEESAEATAKMMEFGIRYMARDNVFAAYGWENLQWGPGFLYSPSNPFFTDNGKKDLIRDFEGKGIAKLVWVKDFNWSFSLMCNTDKGAVDESDFEKTYALKIDYAASQGYGSAMISYKDHSRARLGLYGGVTATDALIIYGEAGFEQGNDAWYPQRIKGSSLAWEMAQNKADSDDIFLTLLLGVSYTFESGNTLTLESLYYGMGYDDGDASNFKHLISTAERFYVSNSGLSGYGKKLLGQSAADGRDFLRQNYLMAQYLNDGIFPNADLIFRITYCLDDQAARLYSSLNYNVSDSFELKAAAIINTGGSDESFAGFMGYQVQAAVEYSY